MAFLFICQFIINLCFLFWLSSLSDKHNSLVSKTFSSLNSLIDYVDRRLSDDEKK